MTHLFKNLIVALLGMLTIFFYYIYFPTHGEIKQGMLGYIFFILLTYGLYLVYRYYNTERKSSITIKTILYFFTLQLLFLCVYFFSINGENPLLGVVLFFKIISIIFFVAFLWCIFWALGKTILELKFFPKIENVVLMNIFSLALGFIIGINGIFFLGIFGLLSFIPVVVLIIIYGIIGCKALWNTAQRVWNISLHEYEHNLEAEVPLLEKLNISRIIDELHYIVITFLISINFISIYRPFPIGWDDLGVYMNSPKMLSASGELLALGKMYLWELYTSIGYVFGSQTYAFFLNSFSGIIASLMLAGIIRMILPKKDYNFDLSLFSVVILLMMPMSVFQLAKDMKLDYGLLFMSLGAVAGIYGVIFQCEQIKEKKKEIFIFLLIGLFIGAAFAIKVISLLLLLGIFAVIFYSWAKMLGFLSFLFLFLGAFTISNLWSMMNVVLLGGDEVKTVGVIFIIIGAFFGSAGHMKYKKSLSDIALQLGTILIGFLIVLIPWGIKHIGEISASNEDISINTLIGGVSDTFDPDYERIHSPDELQTIRGEYTGAISQSGTTDNADFGRYFGYEKGINNYLKLPWNLTFQVNQGGEFTDITYIFFALLPILFIYLPYKRNIYIYPVLASYTILLLYWIPLPITWNMLSFSDALGVGIDAISSQGIGGIGQGLKIFIISMFQYLVGLLSFNNELTNIFAKITLPFGYIFILLFFILPFIYFYYTLEREKKATQIFLSLYAFTSIYVFLWGVSAFGIVWYGIVMYAIFLMLISTIIWHINTENNNKLIPIHFIVLSILWIYIIQSVIPHGITNLRTAGFAEYKLGAVTQEVSLMNFNPDYLQILFNTNISHSQWDSFFREYREAILAIIENQDELESLINQDELERLVNVIKNISDIGALDNIFSFFINNNIAVITPKVENLRQKMYAEIITPSNDRANKSSIYRAGTFLRYYIDNSYNRLLEDNLLTVFQDYFYNEDYNIISQRYKTLGIESLIVDLNTATIDQDPEKNLIKRYENLLGYITSPSLTLIETDSICLRIGLASYKEDGDKEKYMRISGVNYGEKRKSKRIDCIVEILDYIQEGKISKSQNSFLIWHDEFIRENINSDMSGEAAGIYYIGLLYPYIQNGSKALFEIR